MVPYLACSTANAHAPMWQIQVDGAYEDWMEILRLVYYSGELPEQAP